MDLETGKHAPDTSYEFNSPLTGAEEHKHLRTLSSPRVHAKSIFNAKAGEIKFLGIHSGSKRTAGNRASVYGRSDEDTPLVDEKKV